MRKHNGEIAELVHRYVSRQAELKNLVTWKMCRDATGCNNSTIKNLIDQGYLYSEEVYKPQTLAKRNVRRVYLHVLKPYTQRFQKDMSHTH